MAAARWRTAAFAVAAVAVVAAACGSSSSSSSAQGNGITSESASEIVAQSRSTTTSAPSAHVVGLVRTGGQTIQLDFRYQKSTGGKGTVVVNGQSVSLTLVNQDLYMQGSHSFWVSVGGAFAANLLEGKWLKVPANDKDYSNLAELSSLSSLLDQLFSSQATWIKGPQSSINGQPVIAVTDNTPGEGGTLYIATTGPPYLIRAAGGTSGGSGQLNFGGYGEQVTITAPPNPVDISQLNGAGSGQ